MTKKGQKERKNEPSKIDYVNNKLNLSLALQNKEEKMFKSECDPSQPIWVNVWMPHIKLALQAM